MMWLNDKPNKDYILTKLYETWEYKELCERIWRMNGLLEYQNHGMAIVFEGGDAIKRLIKLVSQGV